MENNSLKLIQEWHQLLKEGLINEDDFSKKKAELLKATYSINPEPSKHTNESSLLQRNHNKWLIIAACAFACVSLVLAIKYFPFQIQDKQVYDFQGTISELDPGGSHVHYFEITMKDGSKKWFTYLTGYPYEDESTRETNEKSIKVFRKGGATELYASDIRVGIQVGLTIEQGSCESDGGCFARRLYIID